jgi:hypothetical protein
MLLVPVVLVGMAILFLVEERLRGSWALRAWEREMRGRGEKVSLAELAPPLPTNPAVRIVSPFDAQSQLAGAVAPRDAPGGMQAVASGKARLAAAAVAWLDAAGRTNTWREQADAFEALRVQLAELRPVLTNRTLFIQMNFQEGYELMLPHLAKMKSAMQALNAGTVHALHAGRLGEAYENLMAATFLLDLIGEERLLISQLVRLADAAILQGGVWEALQVEGWTEGQLAALQARWEGQEFMSGMGRALEGERAMAALAYDPKRYSMRKLVEVIDSLQSLGFGVGSGGDGPRSEVIELFEPVLALGRGVRRVTHLVCWRFAWAEQDQLFHHREMQKMIEVARGAARERQWQAEPVLQSEAAREWFFGRGASTNLSAYSRLRYWLALTTLPARTALGKAARMDVVKEQTVAAIALKRHQLRHGRLPPTLEALVPELLSSVPRDWYAAAPLRYRPGEGGSFVLYSFGEDGVDDGGDSRDRNDEVRSVQSGRDLVWPQPASPEEVAAAELKWVKRAAKSPTAR